MGRVEGDRSEYSKNLWAGTILGRVGRLCIIHYQQRNSIKKGKKEKKERKKGKKESETNGRAFKPSTFVASLV